MEQMEQNETKSTITICNTLNNQISNFYSQTFLLNNHIDFKSENDYKNDSDDDFSTSFEKLKKKYKVLCPTPSTPISNQIEQQENNFNNKFKPYTNGYLTSNKINSPQKNNNDDVGFIEPKRILYPREKICLEWKKIMRIGAGLENLGNTCFMNSVLQSLTYCAPLANYLFSIKDEHPKKCVLNFCMICLMIDHVTHVLNSPNSVYTPEPIRRRLRSIARHFNFGRQEDAHEFLRYVIDHMCRQSVTYHEHELGISGLISNGKDTPTKTTTAINHIFGGYWRSQVICLECKSKSNTYDYIMDFMLDIKKISSLEEALEKFFSPESLQNENSYKCLKCNKMVRARKQFNVYRAPNVATFQFKRFDCDRMFGKIVNFISYPENLNLRPYMAEKGPPLMYKLISVLVHYGNTCNSGHYFCYVRNSNNFWYKMNDSNVTQVSFNEVLNQKAYILFYIRQTSDNNNVLRSNVHLNNSVNKTFLNQSKSDITPQKIDNTNDNSNNNNSNNRITNSNFKFNFEQPASIPASATKSSQQPSPTVPKKSLDINNNNNSLKENGRPNIASGNSNNNECFNKKDFQNKISSNNNNNKESLVPYENNDDSDNSKLFKFSSNHKNSSLPNTNLSRKMNGNSENFNKNSNNNENGQREKTTITISKVKAATNSWQIVETSSISNNQNDYENSIENEKKKIESSNSNWKVIKTSATDINYSNSDSNNKKRKHTDFENDHSESDNNFVDKHERRKEKKKKRKKDKSKKRKHNRNKSGDDDDDDESDLDNVELNWVERTKETLEMENKKSHPIENSVPVESCVNKHQSNEKAKLSSDDVKNNNGGHKTEIIDALLKYASNGYGEVKSWNGDVSNLHKAITNDENRRKSWDYNDRYNEEYDQGKTNKFKNTTSNSFELLKCGPSNPFQAQQKARYNNSNNNNFNNGNNNNKYLSKSFHQYNHDSSTSGFGSSAKNKKFKSMNNNNNNSKSFYDNTNSKKYYKMNNNHYHHHHNNNNNSSNNHYNRKR